MVNAQVPFLNSVYLYTKFPDKQALFKAPICTEYDIYDNNKKNRTNE